MSSRFSSSSYLFLLLFSALFHFCFSNQNIDEVLCMDGERQALLRFKHGLIDDTGRLASWVGEESDCCRWAGIVCDNVTHHVHQIHLPALDGHCITDFQRPYKKQVEDAKQRLRGDVSPSLLHLKHLRHLDLSCNYFSQTRVPSFIGSLGNLRYLNLSSSGFGGNIPPQLGNLSELQVLSLGSFYDQRFGYESTRMLNMQWLSSLRLLRHLDMSGMDLSKVTDWFQVINTLPSLVELHLSSCKLSDIHSHVSSINLTSLSVFDLSGNHFYNSSVPRWLFGITSLVSLDLSRCNFNDPISSSIDTFRNMTSLELLHVSENDFMNSSLVLKGLANVGSNLISLDISACGVSSSILDSLQNLTSLLSLDVSYNQLTKAIPKSLGNLCNLREIDLSNNYFQDISLIYLLESFFECNSPNLESLLLQSSKLSGHLPDQLGQLIHLIQLNLGGNNIVGIIPDSIARLSFMRSLELHYNLVSGLVPYSIGGLSSLEMLDLSFNKLNGSLPDSLGQLSKLNRLDLSNNQFKGNVPHSLGQLSKLNYIDLSSNLLTGVVTEAHFANLSELKYLNGTDNKIILRPQLANWIPPFQLQYLHLNSWGLGPRFPLWLQFQRDLVHLDISNTNISATVPELFWSSLPSLIYLDMSQNHIQGTLFSIPATLNVLDLNSNEFTGQIPSLSNGSGPTFLDLSNNFFVGSLHHLLCPSEERFMRVLYLGNNNLSGVIPECWVKWQRLVFLNLENNNLSGEVPRTLGFASSLTSLNIQGNKLSGRLPDSLMNLTNLRFLQLGKNELVGFIPTWLGTKLSYLRSLNLRSNKFVGSIPQEICYLTNIQILDLAHNDLSGTIPRCFNNFSVLFEKENRFIPSMSYLVSTSGKAKLCLISQLLVMKGREDIYDTILGLVKTMDLSSNKFTGHIPSELMTLQGLRSLNLSRNQLTGGVPENIGDMKSLESFDLSLNKLSGELPSSLSSLSFLSNFNVSNNNFTGRIPSGTQLQGFNESSFFGNNLCGDPVTKRCGVEVGDRDQEEEEEDGSDGADLGLIISMVLGFIGGFWITVAPLMVIKSWRIAYFRFMTRVGYMAYDVTHMYCCKTMFPK